MVAITMDIIQNLNNSSHRSLIVLVRVDIPNVKYGASIHLVSVNNDGSKKIEYLHNV